MTNNLHSQDLGKVLRDLRISKGCTLKEAAGNSFSSTHLSNFEHGKTELTCHLLLELLENINVTIMELNRFYNNYTWTHSSNEVSFNEISEAYKTRNITRLEDLLTYLDTQNKILASKHSNLEVIRVKSLIAQLDCTKSLSKKDMVSLTSYFSHLKVWGEYDIVLLGQCYPDFDLGTLSILTSHMIEPTHLSLSINSTQSYIIKTLLNIVSYFIKNKQYNKANQLIDYLKKLEINDYYTFDKISLIYNLAKFDYDLGDDSALETLKTCQEILEFCGYTNPTDIFDKEISELKIYRKK